MGVELNLTGSGTIGTIMPGWSVQEDATPVAIGDSSGGVGSISLAAQHGEDSEFIIDNASSFVHDSLGQISGKVTSLNSSGFTEQTDTLLSIQLTTPISDLAVERTANKVSGYLDPPIFAGNMDFTGVSDANGNIAYHSDNSISYIYSDGSSNLKITRVTTQGVETLITTSVPAATPNVYGFAADASNNYIIALMVAGVPKIYKLTSAGATTWSVGATGSGNGQYAAFSSGTKAIISAVSGVIYVVDYGNNRIQYLQTSNGAYVGQWAITAPRAIGWTGATRVFVMDENHRMWMYSTTGTMIGSQQYDGFSGYNTIGIRFFNRGNDYSLVTLESKSGSGLIGKAAYFADSITSITAPGFSPNAKDWVRIEGTPYAGTLGLPYGTSFTSILVDSSVTGHKVSNFITDGTTLRGLVNYYASLSGVNIVSYQASIDPYIIAPPWTDVVWNKLKELFAAYGIEGSSVNDIMTIRDVGSRFIDPENIITGSASLKLDSRSSANYVNITNYRTAAGVGYFYDAKVDGKVFTVNTGATTTETIKTNGYINVVTQPIATLTPLVGYAVQDSNGLDVTSLWGASNGNVKVSINPTPGLIDVTLTGPSTDLPGATGPYSLAVNGAARTPKFYIDGYGLAVRPQVMTFPTGADDEKTPTENSRDINNIFIDNLARLYERLPWFMVGASGPIMTLTCDIPTSYFDQFGEICGAIIPYKESYYRVISATVNNGTTKITATHYVTTGVVDTLLSGKTTGDFDTFWSGNQTEDFKIKPLRPII